MAASNYITSETDMEGMWNFGIETARFTLIGTRMAELLNFRVNKDATKQVTTAGSLPILKQISEEALQELINAAKSQAVDKPWDFIRSNVMNFMTRKMKQWDEFLEDIAAIEGQNIYVKYSDQLRLPKHSDVRIN